MKNKKIVIGLAILIVIGIIIGVILNKNEKDDDILIMATEAGFAPYEYYKGEEIVGVDVEIANEIAKSLNKKLVIKDVNFDSIINEVKSGKADFAAAGLSITEERLTEVDFSIEYAVSKQVVVVKKDSNIKSVDDLNGKKVSVQLGTIADIVLSEDYPEVELVQEKKYLIAVENVLQGKTDAIVMDMLPAKEIIKQNPELVILDKELFTDTYGIAVKKGNEELKQNINSVLEKLMSEGKIEKYTLKYLGEENV